MILYEGFDKLFAELEEDSKIKNNKVVEGKEEPCCCRSAEANSSVKPAENAVVKCKVADIIAHSEDEKPVDCKMEKAPLEKPLIEAEEVQDVDVDAILNEIKQCDYKDYDQVRVGFGISGYARGEDNYKGSLDIEFYPPNSDNYYVLSADGEIGAYLDEDESGYGGVGIDELNFFNYRLTNINGQFVNIPINDKEFIDSYIDWIIDWHYGDEDTFTSAVECFWEEEYSRDLDHEYNLDEDINNQELDFNRLGDEIEYDDLDVEVEGEFGGQPISDGRPMWAPIDYSDDYTNRGILNKFTYYINDYEDFVKAVSEMLGVDQNKLTQEMIDNIDLKAWDDFAKDYFREVAREAAIEYDWDYDDVNWYELEEPDYDPFDF